MGNLIKLPKSPIKMFSIQIKDLSNLTRLHKFPINNHNNQINSNSNQTKYHRYQTKVVKVDKVVKADKEVNKVPDTTTTIVDDKLQTKNDVKPLTIISDRDRLSFIF